MMGVKYDIVQVYMMYVLPVYFYFPAISTMDSFPSCLVSPVLAVSVWRSLHVSD